MGVGMGGGVVIIRKTNPILVAINYNGIFTHLLLHPHINLRRNLFCSYGIVINHLTFGISRYIVR